MNGLDKLQKIIKCKQRKQKLNSIKSFAVLAGLGVVIGGAIMVLVAQSFCEEIRNNIISNAKDIGEDTSEDTSEDINIKRDEIKQTLKNADDVAIGDVGIAMEKALDDLEDEKQKDNKVIK